MQSSVNVKVHRTCTTPTVPLMVYIMPLVQQLLRLVIFLCQVWFVYQCIRAFVDPLPNIWTYPRACDGTHM